MKANSKSGSKSHAKKGSSKTGSGYGKTGSRSRSSGDRKTGSSTMPYGPGKVEAGAKTSGSGKSPPRMKTSGSWKAPTGVKASGSWKAPTGVKSSGSGSKKECTAERVSGTGIRLNRYIANTGVCSRREADELIRSGSIEVNGKKVTELGTRVGPSDSVRYMGKLLRGEPKVYVLLNKPKDCVTTVKDTHGRNTVMDIVSGCCKERIYPVGRLDRNTTGVLLLTNDGELTDTLSHPSFNKKKIYHIHIDKVLSAEDMKQLREGFDLEDGFIKPDRIEYVEAADKKQIGLEIHSGRNRVVRRMFEYLDYKVLRLDRVYFAGLTKKGLSRGHWRHLNEKEIIMLKMSIPRKKPVKRPSKS